ncbi:MAG: M56 family metallopeptidase [Acutalibacteraceae bacterium]
MDSVMWTIISMSLSASIILMVYFAARRGLQKYLPAAGIYAVMLVIMLRSLVPYSFDFSMMNKIPLTTQPRSAESAAAENYQRTADDAQPVPLVSSDYTDNTDDTNPKDSQNTDYDQDSARNVEKSITASDDTNAEFSWMNLIFVVWLAGALVEFGLNTAEYVVYRRRIMQTAEFSDFCTDMMREIACGKRYPDVYVSPTAETPMLLGSFNTIVLIPCEEYYRTEIDNILRHEYCHFRRLDLLVKWISALSCAVHWFNPLITVVLNRELDRWCELSCDESVARDMNLARRKSYIRTLIRTAERQVNNSHRVPMNTLSGDAKRLNERFNAISSAGRITSKKAAISAAAVMSACILAVVLGTFTRKNETIEQTQPNTQISTNKTDEKAVDSPYDGISYSIVRPNVSWEEYKNFLEQYKKTGEYSEYVIQSGHYENEGIADKLYNLLNFEKYEPIGESKTDTLEASGDMPGKISVMFDDAIRFELDRSGNMLLHIYQQIESNALYPEYPDYSGKGMLYKVSESLYNDVAEVLFTLPFNLSEPYNSDEAGNYLGMDDISCVPAETVLYSNKIHVLSSSYDCDYWADYGSDEYYMVRGALGGLGSLNQIAPDYDLYISDKHIMSITPETYDGKFVNDKITIFADSGVICARGNNVEIWFASDRDYIKICRNLSELKD